VGQTRKNSSRQGGGENSGLSQLQSATEAVTASAPWQSGSSSADGANQALIDSLQQTTISLNELTSVQQNLAENSAENPPSFIEQATSGLMSAPDGLTSALSGGGGLLDGLLGGGGLIGTVLSGIAGLFSSGSNSTPQPVPAFTMPLPIDADAAVGQSTGGQATAGNYGANGLVRPNSQSSNVTVQISAMDSRSFLNRQNDIATAVQQAILSSHALSDTILEL
jgi:hypothetical protein